MEQRQGPFPSPSFLKQLGANDPSPMVALVSGELTTNVSGAPIGVFNFAGKVSRVWISLEGSGKDDTDDLSVTADAKINGTTCLTTQPIIAHVSGEASTTKTTKVAVDTGVTQAVIDGDANDGSPGDVLSFDMALTRVTPDTEMRNFVIAVEIEPV